MMLYQYRGASANWKAARLPMGVRCPRVVNCQDVPANARMTLLHRAGHVSVSRSSYHLRVLDRA